MRRTTICRSRLTTAALTLALSVMGGVLRAQATTRAQRPDTSRAQRPDTSLAGQVPATHTVVRGETLWGISQQYYGDPLLWPEVYRLNTAVVEDPHWIYPGEVLNLSPMVVAAADTTPQTVPQGAADTTKKADTTAVVSADTVKAETTAVAVAPVESAPPPPPPPPPAAEEQSIFEQRATPQEEVHNELRSYVEQNYRPVRRGEFYSAGWLTEGEKLPWADVLGNTVKPAIALETQRTTARPNEEIAIVPPSQASYHVGDSLLIVDLNREISDYGWVVVPHGIARVTAVEEKQVLAQIVAQYGFVGKTLYALPLEPYKNPGTVRPAPVEHGLEAKVITMRDLHPLTLNGQVLFLDKGRAEGVVPGDMFQVYKPAVTEVGQPSEQVMADILIVHTREHTASGLIVAVRSPDMQAGLPARLIKKMPS